MNETIRMMMWAIRMTMWAIRMTMWARITMWGDTHDDVG